MPYEHRGLLRCLTFNILNDQPVIHGVYTRHGGVSPAPWHSLNLGGLNGDERNHVIENRRRIFESVGLPVESIYDAWQVHGTHVICADLPRPLDTPHEKADAILTDREDVTLFMRFADCVPVLLFDPVRRVVGLVHAGWRGTVDRIAAVTVEKMVERYGSRRADILAAVGPSICVDHYQVGTEVVDAARQAFGERADGLLPRLNGGVHFDLWEANRLALAEAGVSQVEVAGVCTCCHNRDWYSHRGENGITGRFGALIALRKSQG